VSEASGPAKSPGKPLDVKTRQSMEPRFGCDFGKVRIHADDHSAKSAETLGARAYTAGRNIVFGRDQYAPGTTNGKALLAHELAHVAQNGSHDETPASQVQLGPANDVAEHEAAAAEKSIAGNAAGPALKIKPRSKGVVRRSLLGGILGGLGGAVLGAAFGLAAGGLVGGIIGGLAGLVVGGLVGNSLTTKERPLTSDEIAYAREVFKDSIDYSEITITRDSMMAVGAPRTLGNTIHLRSDWGHFEGDTMNLTQQGKETLIHEMGHVWQYQHGGLAYIPESLWAQIKAAVGHGGRNAAYNWRDAEKAGLPWEKFNPEQQATAIEDYNKLLRKSKDGTATLEETAELARLVPYMQKVWSGVGAPHFDAPEPQGNPI
jgi:hypothetical protein